jgi:glycerophosphoryl diester phosphodiesterase
MALLNLMEQGVLKLADTMVKHLPQPLPSPARLDQCSIISHRGDHLAPGVKENTLAAFDRARAAGVWGIELDLQWTKDTEPVVIHDPGLERLHGIRCDIADLTLSQLRSRFPSIPSLAEVVTRYGGALHLMIEIKQEPQLNRPGHQRRLRHLLAPLEPSVDYHLLSLHPEMMPILPELPPSTYVAVAGVLTRVMSRWVLKHRWGGFCGHYFLIGAPMIRRHQAAGQNVGIGYARSRNSLFRELNRGVDWIFSNHAAELQTILREAKKQLPDH